MKSTISVLAAALVLVACGSASDRAAEVTATPTTTVAEAPTQEPTVDPTPTPEPADPDPPSYETWQYGPIVLTSEDMDYLPVDPEAIALPDGRIRLFVDGINVGRISSFTSENGIDFVADDAEPVDGTFPNVVQLPDGRYRMYATRFTRADGPPGSGESRVISFISDDALNWKKEKGFRTIGTESSAVILKDGRTLMALRRPSTTTERKPNWCEPEASAVWFAISDDGLTFEDVAPIVDGGRDYGLNGRAYGAELGRLANGQVVLHFEGCLPAYFVPVDEETLDIGVWTPSALRGYGVYDHYGFTENIGGAGGDMTLLVKDGQDLAYVSLRDGPNAENAQDPGVKPPGVRQRIALVTSP